MDTDKISRSSLKQTFKEVLKRTDGFLYTSAIITTIENAPPASDWTPCFEKYPDKDGVYYVTVIHNGRPLTRDQRFEAGNWVPYNSTMAEVIAWMEKPTPYQPPVLDLGRGV